MTGTNSSTTAYLAECLCALGKFDEVEQWVERSRSATEEHDMESQIGWRKPHALLLGHRGDNLGAETMAREAVQLADGTDDPTSQADARIVLAHILGLAGQRDESATRLREAVELYDAKGNVVGAAFARGRLDALLEQMPA